MDVKIFVSVSEFVSLFGVISPNIIVINVNICSSKDDRLENTALRNKHNAFIRSKTIHRVRSENIFRLLHFTK